MRLAFLLLLFANLGFFAYLNYMRPASHAGVDLQKLQIAPEKIRLLKSAKSASTAPRLAAQACLEWGRFAGPTAAKADAFVAELALPEAQVQRVSADVVGHWVYVPPAKTRAAADTNVRRLKQNGISEYALVLEQTRWRYAISLGIFKSEEAARKLLTALHEKGMDDAAIESRDDLIRQVVYYFREPGEAVVAKLAAARAIMPESEIKAVPCPGNSSDS